MFVHVCVHSERAFQGENRGLRATNLGFLRLYIFVGFLFVLDNFTVRVGRNNSVCVPSGLGVGWSLCVFDAAACLL